MCDKSESKRLFKQLKAGLLKWSSMTDDEVDCVLRWHPFLLKGSSIEHVSKLKRGEIR